MKVKYVKSHNNYDFILGQVYEASKYKNGWLMIEGQLYREECFEIIAKEFYIWFVIVIDIVISVKNGIFHAM